MRRRDFIAVLGGTAATRPLAAHAQQTRLPVIGFVDSRSVETMGNRLRGFRRGLEEGEAVEYRWGENRMDRLPDLAADLVRRNVM